MQSKHNQIARTFSAMTSRYAAIPTPPDSSTSNGGTDIQLVEHKSNGSVGNGYLPNGNQTVREPTKASRTLLNRMVADLDKPGGRSWRSLSASLESNGGGANGSVRTSQPLHQQLDRKGSTPAYVSVNSSPMLRRMPSVEEHHEEAVVMETNVVNTKVNGSVTVETHNSSHQTIHEEHETDNEREDKSPKSRRELRRDFMTLHLDEGDEIL